MPRSSSTAPRIGSRRDTSQSSLSSRVRQDNVLSGRIARRTARPSSHARPAVAQKAGKFDAPVPLARIPLDDFFDILANASHADVAQKYGRSMSHVVNQVSLRITEKAIRDGKTRRAVKNELNAARAKYGVIPNARNRFYGTHGERCEQGQEASTSGGDDTGRRVKSCKATSPKVVRPHSMEESSKHGRSPSLIASLADFKGHEIYETGDEDVGNGSMDEASDQADTLGDELEEGEIREHVDDDELEEGEIRESMPTATSLKTVRFADNLIQRPPVWYGDL